MAKAKVEDMNLMDDFLFNAIMSYPGIGEQFGRELLKIIFKRDFGKLTVLPQREYYGTNTEQHGARLDVLLEEELDGADALENVTVYDVEPEQNSKEKFVKVLPRRVRFYHAKIDSGSLKAGNNYEKLKNVVIIMIMPFDPFGADRMIYTIKNRCVEAPEVLYDDGARTLFLYTKGTQGNPPQELQELLHYMEETTKENARNDILRNMHQMVETVKQDCEVTLKYMKIFEREAMLREEGREQGIEEGREQEQVNTERERQRAEAAEKLVDEMQKELQQLREELRSIQEKSGV